MKMFRRAGANAAKLRKPKAVKTGIAMQGFISREPMLLKSWR